MRHTTEDRARARSCRQQKTEVLAVVQGGFLGLGLNEGSSRSKSRKFHGPTTKREEAPSEGPRVQNTPVRQSSGRTIMSFSIEFADETQEYQARIKVIGCGGSGGNAVNTMMSFGLEGVEFIVVNTDAQALNANAAPLKISIGTSVTRGPRRRRRSREGAQGRARGRDAHQGGHRGRRHGVHHRRHGRRHRHRRGAHHRAARPRRGRAHGRRRDQALPLRGQAARAPAPSTASRMLTEHVDTLITIPNEKLLVARRATTSRSSTRSARRTRCSTRRSRASAISSPRTASSTSTSPT